MLLLSQTTSGLNSLTPDCIRPRMIYERGSIIQKSTFSWFMFRCRCRHYLFGIPMCLIIDVWLIYDLRWLLCTFSAYACSYYEGLRANPFSFIVISPLWIGVQCHIKFTVAS